MKVSVVIPAMNEVDAIASTIENIRRYIPDAEILVVDDGSTDGTRDAARKAGAYVWSHPYNIGNGAAVKTGLRLASGDKIILMDGDGQHDPADIPRLLLAAEEYDMVVGARTSSTQANLWRRAANAFYNAVARYATNFPIEDLTSGFRVVDRETIVNYLYLLPNTFSYPTTITLAYLKSGRTLRYLPIEARKRQGKSKIKLLRDGGRFLLILIKIITLFSPLRIFLPVSLSIFTLGLVHYGYTYAVSGRFTNMSALLLSTSVIVFMIGLVSEQITQLRFDRVEKNRP